MTNNKMWFKQWDGFKKGKWCDNVDTRDFIQKNYEPYYDDASFLKGPTKATVKLWGIIKDLMIKEQQAGGVLGMDPRASFINAYGAGYIDKNLEKIVGLQTEKPFVRAFMPRGGIRMAKQAAEQYHFPTDKNVVDAYSNYCITHNDAVFMTYTDEMLLARKSHILTGLPDTYARGRIIGDYRRVALYGVDYLIAKKQAAKKTIDGQMTDNKILQRYELALQINALEELKKMALTYGYDISQPAKNAQEAIQWTYFGYLAAIKDQNGAAMSIGRNSTFFDIYIQRDIKNNLLTEEQAQELIDHYVMKLRIVKFMRITSYNEIFAGDPVWATESLAGLGKDKRPLVTKSSFRILHTLSNMGPAPEPNLTVLWSKKLPDNFKKFCCQYSIRYSSIQYESDDLLRPIHGDDYAIACCVSPMEIGKEMQFFGARANLAKALLYAINNGHDELHPEIKLGPKLKRLNFNKPLTYSKIWIRYKKVLQWLAKLYINTLNVIHYSHDKHYYEALEMGLHDDKITRFFATGIAGFSSVVDSLSAIKYAKVKAIVDPNTKIVSDFKIEGDFPKYGNDNDKVDKIAVKVTKYFVKELRKHKAYRHGKHTMSILTITSNVMYGKFTGATPDGRKAFTPFAPGANPMHGRDCSGAVASLSSVSKIPFAYAADGISNTFNIVPMALGNNKQFTISKDSSFDLDKKNIVGKENCSHEQNLSSLIDGYFAKGAQHLNVNVLNRDTLLDAQIHPENYPQLTIRVSGYAVNFIKLSKQHQDEVIARTFHVSF